MFRGRSATLLSRTSAAALPFLAFGIQTWISYLNEIKCFCHILPNKSYTFWKHWQKDQSTSFEMNSRFSELISMISEVDLRDQLFSYLCPKPDIFEIKCEITKFNFLLKSNFDFELDFELWSRRFLEIKVQDHRDQSQDHLFGNLCPKKRYTWVKICRYNFLYFKIPQNMELISNILSWTPEFSRSSVFNLGCGLMTHTVELKRYMSQNTLENPNI